MTIVDPYQLRLFGVEPRISDEYWSPRWLFDLLDLRFDLDPAAPTGGVPWLPADDWIDVNADGLAQDCTGGSG